MPRIISVISEKGGVSKTTSTLHVAAKIAENNMKVAIIDFDTTQANATSQILGPIWSQDNYKKGICSVITEGTKIDEVVYKTDRENLFIVPSEKISSNGSPFNIEGTLKDMGLEGYMFLKEAIGESSRLQEMDFIFIDNGPTLGITTIATLISSDYYCIPVRTESFSLDSIAPTIETANKVTKTNKYLKPLGIYVALEDKRNKKNLARAVEELENISKQYNVHLFENRIPVNANFSYLPRDKSLIYDLKRGNRGSNEYEHLANEILKRIMEIETSEAEEVVPVQNKSTQENRMEAR
jgi:chromosome partitioning protein